MRSHSESFWIIVCIGILLIALLVGNIVIKSGLLKTITLPLQKRAFVFRKTDYYDNFIDIVPNNKFGYLSPGWGKKGKVSLNTINSDGFNDLSDYSHTKPKNTIRIIALGNSYTFGLFLPTKKNYTEVLEKELNNQCPKDKSYEVINLGVPGYALRFSTERFRLKGAKYRPDLIVWLVTDTDFLIKEDVIYGKMRPDLANVRGISVDYGLVSIFKQLKNSLLEKGGPRNVNNYQLQAFSMLRKYYQGPLIVLSLKGVATADLSPYHMEILGYYLQNKKLTYLTTPFFVKPSGQFPDGHLNEMGNKELALSVLRYLSTNKIVPCP